MIIQSISFKGFSRYRDLQEVVMPPYKCFVVAGDNSAGKTSLIRAIAIFFDPAYIKSDLVLSCRNITWNDRINGDAFVQLKIQNFIKTPVLPDETLLVTRFLNEKNVRTITLNSQKIPIEDWFRLIGDCGSIPRPFDKIAFNPVLMMNTLKQPWNQASGDSINRISELNRYEKELRFEVDIINARLNSLNVDQDEIDALLSKRQQFRNILRQYKYYCTTQKNDQDDFFDLIVDVNKQIQILPYLQNVTPIMDAYRSTLDGLSLITRQLVTRQNNYKADIAFLFEKEKKIVCTFREQSEALIFMVAKSAEINAKQDVATNAMNRAATVLGTQDLENILQLKNDNEQTFETTRKRLVKIRWNLIKELVLKRLLEQNWQSNPIQRLAIQIEYACENSMLLNLNSFRCDEDILFRSYRLKSSEDKIQAAIVSIERSTLFEETNVQSLRDVDKCLRILAAENPSSEIVLDFCGYVFDFVSCINPYLPKHLNDILLVAIFKTKRSMIQFLDMMETVNCGIPRCISLDSVKNHHSTSNEEPSNFSSLYEITTNDIAIKQCVKLLVDDLLENVDLEINQNATSFTSGDGIIYGGNYDEIQSIWTTFFLERKKCKDYQNRLNLLKSDKKSLEDDCKRNEILLKGSLKKVPEVITKVFNDVINKSQNITHLYKEELTYKMKNVEATVLLKEYNSYLNGGDNSHLSVLPPFEVAFDEFVEVHNSSYNSRLKIEKLSNKVQTTLNFMQEIVSYYTGMEPTPQIEGYGIFHLETELGATLKANLTKMESDHLGHLNEISRNEFKLKQFLVNIRDTADARKLERLHLYDAEMKRTPKCVATMINAIVPEDCVVPVIQMDTNVDVDTFNKMYAEYHDDVLGVCKKIQHIDERLAYLKFKSSVRQHEELVKNLECLNENFNELQELCSYEHRLLHIQLIDANKNSLKLFHEFNEYFPIVCAKMFPDLEVKVIYLLSGENDIVDAKDASMFYGLEIQAKKKIYGKFHLVSASSLPTNEQDVIRIAFLVTMAVLLRYPVIYLDDVLLNHLDKECLVNVVKFLNGLPNVQSFCVTRLIGDEPSIHYHRIVVRPSGRIVMLDVEAAEHSAPEVVTGSVL